MRSNHRKKCKTKNPRKNKTTPKIKVSMVTRSSMALKSSSKASLRLTNPSLKKKKKKKMNLHKMTMAKKRKPRTSSMIKIL